MNRRRPPIAARLSGLAAVALFALACSSDPVQRAGLPGASGEVRIQFVKQRGDHYLDALISTGGRDWRYLLPRGGDCDSIGAREDVRFVSSGLLGSLRTDDLRCDPNGTLSLRAFRDRISRSRPPSIPTGRATYEIFYKDAELALARGRFPLVGLIGWTGGEDTVAVIPVTDDCSEALERTIATIEYRASGPQPLTLTMSGGRCPLLGLAFPPK